MKKKSFALLLVLCMMFSLLPFGAAAAGFQDVAADAYYHDPVDWALNHEPQITNGTSPTTFSPEDTCTRAHIVTFLFRAKQAETVKDAENPFTDIPADTWFTDPVLWANANNITNGDGSPTIFHPDGTCTRAQIVTFLFRAK